MKNTIQLYVDEEKEIKGYPITSPDRVVDSTGKSIKDKLKNNVKFDVVRRGVDVPPVDGTNNITEIKTQIRNINNELSDARNGDSKLGITLRRISNEITHARNGEEKLGTTIRKITDQLETKVSKSTVTETTNKLQQQINNLVLNNGGDSNPEVVQARGSFDTLNDRLTSNEYTNYNTVKNLCDNMSVTKYEGDTEIISTEGNILSFKINSSNSSASTFKLGVHVKKGRRYIVCIKLLSESILTNLSHRVILGNWKLNEAASIDSVFSFECKDSMDNGEYTFAVNTTEIGKEHKVQFFIYEDIYHNDYLLESCKVDIKKPRLWNADIESLYTPLYSDRIIPVITDIHRRVKAESYLYTVRNHAILFKDAKYFVAVDFSDGEPCKSMSIGSITSNTWDQHITSKSMDVRLSGDKTFFTAIIQPTVDTKNLSFSFGSVPVGSRLEDVRIFVFKLDDENIGEMLLQRRQGFDEISFIQNNNLSSLKNDLNINDMNRIAPIYTANREINLTGTSGFFMAIDAIKLYRDKRYYISVEVPEGAYSRYLKLRTLVSGSWTDVINVDLSLRQYNEQHYYEGFFSPSEDIFQVLYFNYNGATVNKTIPHNIRIYEVKDNITDVFLNRLGGYKRDILDIKALSNYDPLLAKDTFEYLDRKVTTRTEPVHTAYFQATNTIRMSKDKLYYIAIDWKKQPLFTNSLYVRTITGGVWDKKVDAIVYPRYTRRGTYYECYFSPTENIENSLYLNFSGGVVDAQYEYDVYVYEIEHEMQEYALRAEYGFLNPSFRLANTSDRHFRGKVCSALGDSLTGTGSGGHYLQFMKNILGFSKVKQCGVGGSTVCGTGPECMWQTKRINDLMIDSDYILFKGSTNDSGYITVNESEFTIENCDVTTFVGAYNVALSKIYYKYLKLSKGYYADKGIDYSEVTQADTPKDIKIFLITTPKTLDNNASKRQIFAEYVRRIGQMWGLPIIDANAEMQMNPFNYPVDFVDKVHYPLQFHYNLAKLAVGKMREVESY